MSKTNCERYCNNNKIIIVIMIIIIIIIVIMIIMIIIVIMIIIIITRKGLKLEGLINLFTLVHFSSSIMNSHAWKNLFFKQINNHY